MKAFPETIEELKEDREEIIEQIIAYSEIDDKKFIKEVMIFIADKIVNGINIELDESIDEIIQRCIKEVKGQIDISSFVKLSDMRENQIRNNLPSSLR